MKKNQKRKRPKQTLEEAHAEEKAFKHSGLVAMATKSIRKESKAIKLYECQKIVKQIKLIKDKTIPANEEGKGSSTSDKGKEDKVTRRMKKLDEKLKRTKEFELEDLVNVCLRRLGLVEGTVPASKSKSRKGTKTDSSSTGSADTNDMDNKSKKSRIHEENSKSRLDDENDERNGKEFNSALIETMLQHKKLKSAVDALNEKVLEFRNWATRREEWIANRGSSGGAYNNDEGVSGIKNENFSKKRKKGSSADGRPVDVGGHDTAGGMFIESLSGMPVPESYGEENELGDSGNYDDYGGDGFNDEFYPKKKNRKGQRARKAKAMAIEAKKAGRVWNNSVNWREKKKDDSNKDSNTKMTDSTSQKTTSASGLDTNSKVKASDVATMGKTWKEEGQAHPSWAAREAQKAKSGLVQFTGKKITFD